MSWVVGEAGPPQSPGGVRRLYGGPDEIRTHTEWILSPMPPPIGLRGCYSHQYVKEQKNPSLLERGFKIFICIKSYTLSLKVASAKSPPINDMCKFFICGFLF